jgi:hypothetical protein
MHTETQAAAEQLDEFFATPANYAHAANITAVCTQDFTRSTNDSFVQSAPPAHAVRVVDTPLNAHSSDMCVDITDAGRDALRRSEALAALFGRPWPTVAQARAIGVCTACHYVLTSPSCAAREHAVS